MKHVKHSGNPPLRTHRWGIYSALLAASVLAGCGGGGGGGGGTPAPAPTPSGSTVVVSGKITFDRIPFRAGTGTGLNPTAPVESPARHVVVEAIDAGNSTTILATTTTDTAGDYSLAVPINRDIFMRAKAQMQQAGAAPTWNFRVLNNTNGDALYALVGSNFNSGSANSTRNLRAASGWGTTSYTSDAARTAAPFAILDSIYRAKELVLTGSVTANFPALDLYWSASNRPTVGAVCPDNGDIGTSFYIGAGESDECPSPAPLPAGIYILGDFSGGNGDTDEFDQHIVIHEFGHYFEDRFSRSDSIGGAHGGGDRLDLRVAFGEGWGNALSGMATADPVYRDSRNGVSSDFGINMENDSATAEGWFSEASVHEVLWDIFDGATEPGDTVALGFAPIFAVMTGAQVSTDALTSIFPFANAIRSANGTQAGAITALLNGESISGTDDFGANESNNGGTDASVLPIYVNIDVGQPVIVCSRARYGTENKLENNKFLRFVNASTRNIGISVTGVAGTGTAATDPDVYVYRRGVIVTAGVVQGNELIQAFSVPAGTYVIEVFDANLNATSATPRCMSVSLTG
jgi:hypothetical protein